MVCTRCELSSLDELTELWRPFIRFRMDWCVQHHRDQSWIWSVSQFIHTFNKWIMPRTGLMDSTIWKTHIFITGAWCAFWTPTLYQYLNSLFFYFFLRILCIHCFFTPNDNNKQWVCGAVYCLFLLLLVDAFRQYQLLFDPFEWTSVGTTVDVVCISTDTCLFPAYVATTFFWSYWFHLKKKIVENYIVCCGGGSPLLHFDLHYHVPSADNWLFFYPSFDLVFAQFIHFYSTKYAFEKKIVRISVGQ